MSKITNYENCPATGDEMEKAFQIVREQFDKTDRIDSATVEKQHGEAVLIVNANMGDVGSGTCEFVWKL